jgi:peptidoglycan hydrolase FlgJ
MSITAVSPILPAAKAVTPTAAHKAGKDFEAMFVGQMLESMFTGLGKTALFGGGQAETTWRSFMLQEYGKAIAETGSLGIGRMVEADVARLYGLDTKGAGK